RRHLDAAAERRLVDLRGDDALLAVAQRERERLVEGVVLPAQHALLARVDDVEFPLARLEAGEGRMARRLLHRAVALLVALVRELAARHFELLLAGGHALL